MDFDIPASVNLADPLLGFRFGLVFLGYTGQLHPLDFRFQSVSGLSASVTIERQGGSGTNVVNQALPQELTYSNLVLRRGSPRRSSLTNEIQKSLNEFRFTPHNVLLSVLDENAKPINSWLFSDAFPVRWTLSGIDANSHDVMIEEIELNYSTFKSFNL